MNLPKKVNPFSKELQTDFIKEIFNKMTDTAVDEAIKKAGSWEEVDGVELMATIVNGYTNILHNFIES